MVKKYFLIFTLLFLTLGCDKINKIKEFYDTFKTGAKCDGSNFCLDGECFTENQGFPGGMCTGDCDKQQCFSLNAACFKTKVGGVDRASCLPGCDIGRSCKRSSEGYQCVIYDDSFVCVPPSALATEVPGITGATCTVDSDCDGTNPICMSDFKNGYCSQASCTLDGDDCLNQNPCVLSDPNDPTSKTLCLKGCASADDCRFGYECVDFSGKNVCMPAKTMAPKNPEGADDGEPCIGNIKCKGGTCIRQNTQEGGQQSPEDEAYPGGYCTTRDCSSNFDCNGSSICVARGRTTACFAQCSTNSDCRKGYECVETPTGKICDSAVKLPDVKVEKNGDVQVVCQSSGNLEFDVPNGAIGFYISPFTKDRNRIVPQTLSMPDGTTLNIATDYAFMAINPDILGTISPILFPATDIDPLASSFTGGTYTLNVRSSAREVCYYVIPKMNLGSSLEVRIHLVGVKGVTADSASSNRDLQEVIQAMKNIYSKMNVNVTVNNYVSVSSDVEKKYKIIRNFNDIYSLVATSKNLGESLLDNLVVNVFLIEDFAIAEAPGLLGVSTGIPGVAGLNGNIGSGLVFTSASLGLNNQQLGQTMAHEVGHFIALRHTTEHKGSTHDPISDTGECKTPDLQYACPDARNFMFAYAMGGDQTEATNGQSLVIRHSPLVK